MYVCFKQIKHFFTINTVIFIIQHLNNIFIIILDMNDK